MYSINQSVFIFFLFSYHVLLSAADALIDAIKSDIAYADSQLDLPEFSELQKHSYFSAEKPQDHTNGDLIIHGSNL